MYGYTEEPSYIGQITDGFTVELSDGSTLDSTSLLGDGLEVRILYDDTSAPGSIWPIWFDFTDLQMEQLAELGVTVTGLSFDSNASNITATWQSEMEMADIDASMTLTDQWLLHTNLVFDGSGTIIDQLQNATFDVDGYVSGGDFVAESTTAFLSDDDSSDVLIADGDSTADTIYVQDSTTLSGTTSGLAQVIGVTGYTITQLNGNTFTEADFGQLPVRVLEDGSVSFDLDNLVLGLLDGDSPIASISFSATATEFDVYGGYFHDAFHDAYTPVCVTRGTRIQTIRGEIAVEELVPGDQVQTCSNGFQRIRWIGSSECKAADFERDDRLCPIRITAGAMGEGLPKRDLLVSRPRPTSPFKSARFTASA